LNKLSAFLKQFGFNTKKNQIRLHCSGKANEYRIDQKMRANDELKKENCWNLIDMKEN
jgi:hypothetical protein